MDESLSRLQALLLDLEPDPTGKVRLPSERELAATLGMQRSTLRERLAVFETLGLIERTQGSGTYLTMPNPTFVQIYFDLALKIGFITIDQLEQAREMIEREVARAAAVNATSNDVEALRRSLKGILEAEDTNASREADYQFHLCLIYASHNPVFFLVIEGLAIGWRRVLRHRYHLVQKVDGAVERINATHSEILAAVENGDADGAMLAMDKHFRIWNEEYRKLTTLFSSDGPWTDASSTSVDG